MRNTALIAIVFLTVSSPFIAHASTSCVLDPSICTGNTFCGTDGTCQSTGSPTTPPPKTTQPATPTTPVPAVGATPTASGPAPSTQTGPKFISLSKIPALGLDQKSTPSLPVFLNELYKICIGLAVVIAVLQLIRGGVTYMLVDSVTTKEQARHSITAAILGLILVLSPYIVFSVINPQILSLKIDVAPLQTDVSSQYANQQTAQQLLNGTPSTFVCDSTGCGNQAAACVDGSSKTEACRKTDGTIDSSTSHTFAGVSGDNYSCPDGETLVLQCNASVNNPGSGSFGANGCNAPTGGPEYQQVSCKTDEDAQNWSNQNCSGAALIQKGVCTQGTDSSGQCIGGQESGATCLGVSSQFTFFQVNSDPSRVGYFQFRPVTNDLNAAEGFISACTSGNVCMLAGSYSSQGTCPAGSYSRQAGLTDPACYSAKLLCSEPQMSKCQKGVIIIGN